MNKEREEINKRQREFYQNYQAWTAAVSKQKDHSLEQLSKEEKEKHLLLLEKFPPGFGHSYLVLKIKLKGMAKEGEFSFKHDMIKSIKLIKESELSKTPQNTILL